MERGSTVRRHLVLDSPFSRSRSPPDRLRYRNQQTVRSKVSLPVSLLSLLIGGLLFIAALVLGVGFWQLRSLNTGADWPGWSGIGRPPERRPLGTRLWFVPSVDLIRKLDEGERILDQRRSAVRIGVRPPRVALVLGSMYRDPETLLLLTLVKSLQELGYTFTVFSLEDGDAHSLWEYIGCKVEILSSDGSVSIDWSNYEGVVLSSLDAKKVLSSLMHEPFEHVPVVWLIQEDVLGKRLSSYAKLEWKDLINDWKSSFKRADVVVFPDYFLPILYTALDSGNFYVIPGSPMNGLALKNLKTSQSRYQLREENGFTESDFVTVVVGSYIFYDEVPWDYAAVMNALASSLVKIEKIKAWRGRLKFVLLCGNSMDDHCSVFKDLASRLQFLDGSVRHFGLDSDVSNVLLMADVVLYGSFQEEQSFPPLLMRAMSFGIPMIVPDLAIVKKHVVDKVHGVFFHPHDPESLARAFSLLIGDEKLSKLANVIASYAKSLSKNILASDCISEYGKLLEKVFHFPSDVILPDSSSQVQQKNWAWDLLDLKAEGMGDGTQHENFMLGSQAVHKLSTVDMLEQQYSGKDNKDNSYENGVGKYATEYPTQSDWDDINEMEISEDLERREMQEIEDRMEKTSESWEDVYRNARKAEKQKFEINERDEGELERIGQVLCIYEIYNGEGSWSFLHHGSLYRAISLLRGARRLRSDDVDAVGRLPVLDDAYYRNLICELGAMFSVASRIDNIHKIPWIGFQSWRAVGKKVSLSAKAEKALEDSILTESRGDVLYFWVTMDVDHINRVEGVNDGFWSVCDILNSWNCRTIFKESFRNMYGLPSNMESLPPMPADGGNWSALHSWVMPTPSFMQFIMFSRMFADSLDRLVQNRSSPGGCVLGSSILEQRHCYCRVLEILVNVWAFHSARKMIYINPETGELREQHPINQRKGLMWVKYFDFALLKSMDEDLAEEADDAVSSRDRWLWPLTGEVIWQGMLDIERESRYRNKMDKKRKIKEKLLDRQKHGYKQKSLAG